MVWVWMLWSPYALGTRTELWFGRGCSGRRMLLEHERNYGFGMDAPYALGTQAELWFGHGCSGCHTFNTRSAQGILGLQLQGPSFLYVLTIRLPRLCTAVWPRRGFDLRRSRSLQESALALKVLRAKLGNGQLHCTDAGRATA